MRLTDAQIDRACGVLIGAAAGDALGAGYEFNDVDLDLEPEMIGGGLGPFAPGEWTDDTAMMVCIAQAAAEGLDISSREGLDRVAQNFRAWFESGPKDIGGTTIHALDGAGPSPTGWKMAKVASERKGATNGSLMRTGAVALAFLDDEDKCFKAAARISRLTHTGQYAVEACVLWTLAVRHAVLEGEFDIRRGMEYLEPKARDTWDAIIHEAETQTPETFHRNSLAIGAFQAAWSSIYHTPVPQQFTCEHLEETLKTCVRVGWDTDTVACIAGALLGARWGMSAVSSRWRKMLHGYPGLDVRDLERLAVLSATKGEGEKYGWPKPRRIDYTAFQLGVGGMTAYAQHPHDPGVYIGGAPALDDLPDDIDAVVTLCRVGTGQVPRGVQNVVFRLKDEPNLEDNPNLVYVLRDVAREIASLRAEGKTVYVHCVAALSRTPTAAIAYSMYLGVPGYEAWDDVTAALPGCRPNVGFRDGLVELYEHLTETSETV